MEIELRRWRLDCCEVSAGFQSSVKDFQVGRYFISDRRTQYPPPTPFFDKRSDFVDYPSEARPLELCSLAWARTRSLSPREGSVDGWGKYGLKGQNKSAQGNALGIVHNQHSPRMGKRIIIPFTPFATLQWWAVILLPPSGAYPCCILSPHWPLLSSKPLPPPRHWGGTQYESYYRPIWVILLTLKSLKS